MPPVKLIALRSFARESHPRIISLCRVACGCAALSISLCSAACAVDFLPGAKSVAQLPPTAAPPLPMHRTTRAQQIANPRAGAKEPASQSNDAKPSGSVQRDGDSSGPAGNASSPGRDGANGANGSMPVPASEIRTPRFHLIRTRQPVIFRSLPQSSQNDLNLKREIDVLSKEDHPDLAVLTESLLQLGQNYANESNYTEAQQTLKRVVSSFQEVTDLTQQYYLATAMIKTAQNLVYRNDNADAILLISPVVAKTEGKGWAGTAEMAQMLQTIGESLHARQSSLQSEPILEAACRLYERVSAAPSLAAVAHSNLGSAYVRLTRYADAEAQFKKALALYAGSGSDSDGQYTRRATILSLAELYVTDHNSGGLRALEPELEKLAAEKGSTGSTLSWRLSNLIHTMMQNDYGPESEKLGMALISAPFERARYSNSTLVNYIRSWLTSNDYANAESRQRTLKFTRAAMSNMTVPAGDRLEVCLAGAQTFLSSGGGYADIKDLIDDAIALVKEHSELPNNIGWEMTSFASQLKNNAPEADYSRFMLAMEENTSGSLKTKLRLNRANDCIDDNEWPKAAELLHLCADEVAKEIDDPDLAKEFTALVNLEIDQRQGYPYNTITNVLNQTNNNHRGNFGNRMGNTYIARTIASGYSQSGDNEHAIAVCIKLEEEQLKKHAPGHELAQTYSEHANYLRQLQHNDEAQKFDNMARDLRQPAVNASLGTR